MPSEIILTGSYDILLRDLFSSILWIFTGRSGIYRFIVASLLRWMRSLRARLCRFPGRNRICPGKGLRTAVITLILDGILSSRSCNCSSSHSNCFIPLVMAFMPVLMSFMHALMSYMPVLMLFIVISMSSMPVWMYFKYVGMSSIRH